MIKTQISVSRCKYHTLGTGHWFDCKCKIGIDEGFWK